MCQGLAVVQLSSDKPCTHQTRKLSRSKDCMMYKEDLHIVHNYNNYNMHPCAKNSQIVKLVVRFQRIFQDMLYSESYNICQNLEYLYMQTKFSGKDLFLRF